MFSLLRPEIREMIGEDIDRLITACKPILHFEYFFKDEILLRLNVGKENAKGNRVILKYYNKFMPPTLRQVATLIDPLMRELETGNETSLCRECDKKPSKKFKCGPGSLCS